ncbi:MAG: class I SAM-dependent methyltransferase [Planctomycetaceae bacterium]|nr:class I SAM-dependent methyltransferase [Planctomycetaceae bacterium]
MSGNSQSPTHWDQRYVSGDAPWNSGMVSRELVRVLQEERITPCRAFELGCGAGTNAVALAQQGFEVTAADFSPVAIGRARTLAAEAGVAVRFVAADLCRSEDLRAALEIEGATACERQCSFLFDRGCYHCARRVNLAGFLETVDWLAAPQARLLVLSGNANEPMERGPPRVTDLEIRAEWSGLFEIEWIREFRFEDRGGVPGPRGWSCLMARR